ncbi:MAG: phenylacetate-CoA oxygenase subunit PaaJ [Chloroflexi bacterium]|nr:phenylacetate-CoA oxygenase subunit PaaJ [Chloroflexota bacterium]
MMIEIERLWQALNDVPDPELPVVSLVELGIVRDVQVTAGKIVVTITPTFSGCPAHYAMQDAICDRLRQVTDAAIEIMTTYSPPWSSDWITDTAREKLRAFGIAPAPRHGGNVMLLEAVTCPNCGSANTVLRNPFGPTPCRMIYTCNDCRQPFEAFKPL